MRTRLIRTAALVGSLMMVWLSLPITAAAAATASKVPNSEEAWFLARREPLAEAPGGDPTCNLPTQCNASGNAMRPNPHPENVLVVAANSGDPDAQTYFNFDTGKLPLGAVITGGTVTLPVARDPDARNFRPAAATMVACRVTGFIPGGTDAGSYKDRPTFDEDTCVEVKQVKTDPLTYSVDLTRFGKVWSADPLKMMGITLRVDPKIQPPAPDETWRVVFNTQRRADQKSEEESQQPEASRAGFPAITSTLQYRVEKLAGLPGPIVSGGGGGNTPTTVDPNPFPAAETTTTGGGGSGVGGGGGGGGGGFASGDTSVASADTGASDLGASAAAPAADTGAIAAPSNSAAAPVDQPATAAPPQNTGAVAAGPALQPAAAPGASPVVWIMPLIALAMAGAMAWSLMQPVELVGDREGAVSKLMRTRRLSAQNPSS